MKKVFVIFLIITCMLVTFCMAGCGNSANVTSGADDKNPEESRDLAVDFTKMRRGVNMSGLEYPVRQTGLFEEGTYEELAEKGFDHIRLTTDFRLFADEDGTLSDSKMKKVDKAMRLANEHGLIVLLDFHGWYDFNTIKGDDMLFMKIWRGIAERYKDYEYNDMLIFELINEPHTTEGGNLDMSTLSKLQCMTADIVRDISPNRSICFATTEWNGPWTLDSYKNSSMMNYDNVIVALHSYATLEFTHQNMPWMNNMGVIVKLDDNILDALKEQLNDIVDFKKETGVPAILDEFGFNTDPDIIPYEDQARYAQTVVDVLGEHDIPCTWWAYRDGGFGLQRKDGIFSKYKWNDTVVNILTEK